jgi:signal transduction histidine kinase
MRELGGSLEIQSKGEGTKVIITVPLLEKLATQSAGDGNPKRSVSAA